MIQKGQNEWHRRCLTFWAQSWVKDKQWIHKCRRVKNEIKFQELLNSGLRTVGDVAHDMFSMCKILMPVKIDAGKTSKVTEMKQGGNRWMKSNLNVKTHAAWTQQWLRVKWPCDGPIEEMPFLWRTLRTTSNEWATLSSTLKQTELIGFELLEGLTRLKFGLRTGPKSVWSLLRSSAQSKDVPRPRAGWT